MRLDFESSPLGLCVMILLASIAAVCRHLTKIMLGVLKISFGGYSIACR